MGKVKGISFLPYDFETAIGDRDERNREIILLIGLKTPSY
jgi:hypothetical protein